RQPRPLSSQTRGDRRFVLAFRRSGVDPDFHFCLSHLAALFRGTVMSTPTHTTANYLKIFYILLALTIVEVTFVYLHLPKLLLVGLLMILAVWKAALVAM